MANRAFRLLEGSAQERFMQSRAKIRMIGGGFANGKTAASCIECLKIARDYPGANILMARSTYPRLNDTLRKEFLRWCPKEWIKSFPMSNNGSNTCTLKNDTTINFRYVAQQGTNVEATTSNLLSATYDAIFVDQIEDPEIVHKDLLDLIGRLRGNAVYVGNDPTMPRTGPRMMVLTCNPTANWVYTRVVRPYHQYKEHGIIMPDLLCLRDSITHEPILDDDGKPTLLLEIFEASTYDNAENLGEDYLRLLESSYTGQMFDRYVMGKWGAFQGLVYSGYNAAMHMLPEQSIREYLDTLIAQNIQPTISEGYDYGMAVPSCYMLAFTDPHRNTFVVDGFYKAEMLIGDQADAIEDIRNRWELAPTRPIYADPSIFRRSSQTRSLVGKSIAELFHNGGKGIVMQRGNNEINNGIEKVSALLIPNRVARHPITGKYGSPKLFFNEKLTWIDLEFTNYMWATNAKGERLDTPRDKDDHAMDTLRYLFSWAPTPARVIEKRKPIPVQITQWQERHSPSTTTKAHRYGFRT